MEIPNIKRVTVVGNVGKGGLLSVLAIMDETSVRNREPYHTSDPPGFPAPPASVSVSLLILLQLRIFLGLGFGSQGTEGE